MSTLPTIDAFTGEWALITGASAGIGEVFARKLAEKKLNLVLVARREDRLRVLAEDITQKTGVTVRILAIDLSREDFLPALAAATNDINIAVLVNNAGFGISGRFLDNSLTRELEMLHLNCRAPLVLAHHFAPIMRARKKGAIIFLASILGHAAVPRMSHYAATKGYDLLLAEGLAHELAPSGISVLALCPGETESEFSAVSGMRPSRGRMSAEAVVDLALASIGHRAHIVPGLPNRLLVFLARLLPRRAMTNVMARGAASLRQQHG